MPRNQLTKDEMHVRVLKLKKELHDEQISGGVSHMIDKYLDKVLDILDEYRY
jgi:hypothetical protein|tara:strand:- start:319 stop:474 length:156 start_codon:yes stop_codon:yes gene_type:complete